MQNPFDSGAALRTHLDLPQLCRQFVQNAVHVFVAVGAAVNLRELDCFVDHDAIRHLELAHELVAAKKEYPALDGRKLVYSAVEKRSDPSLQLGCVMDRAVE